MIAIRNRLYSILLGGSLLPKCNLIFDWKSGYDEKVAGNTPKVLYPCFKGDGTKNISANLTSTMPYIRFTYNVSQTDNMGILGRSSSTFLQLRSNYIQFRISSINFDSPTFVVPLSAIVEITMLHDENGYRARYDITGFDAMYSSYQSSLPILKFTKIGAGYGGGNPIIGDLYDITFDDITFSLIGHAYGFKPDGTVITGTPSDDSCFTGLCEYNPEEGYNDAPDGNNNLVIPQSHTDSTKDVLGADLVDFLGGNVIAAPYCKVDFEQVENLGSNLVNKVDEDFDATKAITLNANLTSGNTYKVSYEMREAGTALEVSGDLTTTNIDFSLGWHTVDISAVNTGNSVTFTMTGGKIRNLSIQEVLSADNEPTNILPFKRVNPDYNDLDNLTYEGFDPAHVYRWNATELMRGVEWIKSLQPDWHIFMKIRDEDKVPSQIVAYRGGYKNALSFDGIDDYVLFEGVDVIIDASIRVNIADSGWQTLTLAEAISNNIFYQSGSTVYLGRGETIYTECLIDYAILISANKTYTYNLNGSGNTVIDSSNEVILDNMVLNSSVESPYTDGVADKWMIYNSSGGSMTGEEETSDVYVGNSSQKIINTSNPHNSFFQTYNYIHFIAGITYELSFSVKVISGILRKVLIYSGEYSVKKVEISTCDWKKVTLRLKAQTSSSTGRIHFQQTYYNPCEYLIDDITVRPVYVKADGMIDGAEWVYDEDATPTGETTYKKLSKVLKATKDKVTDVTDYALYINGNSAMLNQNGVPAEVGDTVSKIHSISNELIVSQTDETKQPTLQTDSSLLFASGDEMLFKDKDGNPVSITGTVKINGIEKTLIDSSRIQYGDLDNGILISLIKE